MLWCQPRGRHLWTTLQRLAQFCVKFHERVYIPEDDCALTMNEGHKTKNFTQSVRRQPAGDPPAPGQELLNERSAMQHAAQLLVTAFDRMSAREQQQFSINPHRALRVLEGHVHDRQSVAAMRCVPASAELAQRMEMPGYERLPCY